MSTQTKTTAPAVIEAEGITFHPRAWLKLKTYCHMGDHEITGMGISSADDLLYVEDFRLIKHEAGWASVEPDMDWFEQFYGDLALEQGISPNRSTRIWCHTHPNIGATPSTTDVATFAETFGGNDWAVMFILDKSGACSARLQVRPSASNFKLTTELKTYVDWKRLPDLIAENGIDFGYLQKQFDELITVRNYSNVQVSGYKQIDGFKDDMSWRHSTRNSGGGRKYSTTADAAKAAAILESALDVVNSNDPGRVLVNLYISDKYYNDIVAVLEDESFIKNHPSRSKWSNAVIAGAAFLFESQDKERMDYLDKWGQTDKDQAVKIFELLTEMDDNVYSGGTSASASDGDAVFGVTPDKEGMSEGDLQAWADGRMDDSTAYAMMSPRQCEQYADSYYDNLSMPTI